VRPGLSGKAGQVVCVSRNYPGSTSWSGASFGSRPRGRPKRTWKEVVQKDCQARKLNREDAMDRGRWKKLIKIG